MQVHESNVSVDLNKEMIDYMAANTISKQQLVEIRELEAKYSAEIVDSKVSRDGIKLLARINAMYEHRMTELVPNVVRAERAFTLAAQKHFVNSAVKGH